MAVSMSMLPTVAISREFLRLLKSSGRDYINPEVRRVRSKEPDGAAEILCVPAADGK